jgi:hypothetical protein
MHDVAVRLAGHDANDNPIRDDTKDRDVHQLLHRHRRDDLGYYFIIIIIISPTVLLSGRHCILMKCKKCKTLGELR